MKTIYVDHNIVHYFVAGFPLGRDEAQERNALDWIQADPDQRRIVFSLWNIIEASREEPEARVQALARFMEECNPLWAVERRNIQHLEVKNYVYAEVLGHPEVAPPISVIKNYLSEVLDILSPQAISMVGVTVDRLTTSFCRDRRFRDDFQAMMEQVPQVLRGLQEARQSGTLTPEIDEETLRRWLIPCIPNVGPEGQPIDIVKFVEVLEVCVRQYKDLLAHCPCMQAEILFKDYRTGDSRRNPQPQDGTDLMHAVVAVSYCDAFVTNDGYVYDQAQRYRRDTSRPLIVTKTLCDAVTALA